MNPHVIPSGMTGPRSNRRWSPRAGELQSKVVPAGLAPVEPCSGLGTVVFILIIASTGINPVVSLQCFGRFSMAKRYRSRGNDTVPSRVIPVDDPCVPLDIDRLFPGKYPLEVEIGSGSGRFLVSRAQTHPEVNYIAIERLLGRVRALDGRATRRGLDNIRIVRLEALYTLYYLLPRHGVSTVYVFFPDPWPKRRHHGHRLFSPVFLDALWHTLETGGCVQVATDHLDYFEEIRGRLGNDRRFAEVPAMRRSEEEQTDFELLFRSQGLPIGQCAFKSLPVEDEKPLEPMTLPPEMLPRERPVECGM